MKYLFFIFGVFVFISGCTASRSFVLLEKRVTGLEAENNRLIALEENFSDMKKRFDEDNNSTVEQFAEIKYQIRKIKEDVQRLEGLIGETAHNFKNSGQRDKKYIERKIEALDNAVSRNYERLIIIEKHIGVSPPFSGIHDTKILIPKEKSEKKLYDFAKKLFDEGKTEDSRIQFNNFIKRFPDSQRADNAKFWIAETYYYDKWYERAILEYEEMLDQYPDSNKRISAKLKQGYAFAEIGEKGNARFILEELVKKYPDSDEAKYAANKLKSLN